MLTDGRTNQLAGRRYRGTVSLVDFMAGDMISKPMKAGSTRIKWKRRHTISPRYYFNLRDGGALKDLADLHSALLRIEDDQFQHHCNAEKNDFADWVETVFGEQTVAQNMRRSESREELRSWLEQCLYF